MIIDAYNNVWQAAGTSDYLTAESYTPEDMIRSMDQAGVDMAVGCSLGQMMDNGFIAETMRKQRLRRKRVDVADIFDDSGVAQLVDGLFAETFDVHSDS